MKKFLIGALTVLGAAFHTSAMTPASFPGGQEAQDAYIAANLKYPETAKANGIEGVVCVAFTVKADGTIGNIAIKRMVDPDLESESIRLVKLMPVWIPAQDNGTPVESVAEIAVPFTLGD